MLRWKSPSDHARKQKTGIYRESTVARAPESIEIPLELPSPPLLQVAFGVVDDAPVTFRVTAGDRPLVEHEKPGIRFPIFFFSG